MNTLGCHQGPEKIPAPDGPFRLLGLEHHKSKMGSTKLIDVARPRRFFMMTTA